MTDAEFVRHEPCDNCGSSDANSLYTDGHKFCFSCQTYTPAEGINLYSQSPRKMDNVKLRGEAEALHRRGLSDKPFGKVRIY